MSIVITIKMRGTIPPNSTYIVVPFLGWQAKREYTAGSSPNGIPITRGGQRFRHGGWFGGRPEGGSERRAEGVTERWGSEWSKRWIQTRQRSGKVLHFHLKSLFSKSEPGFENLPEKAFFSWLGVVSEWWRQKSKSIWVKLFTVPKITTCSVVFSFEWQHFKISSTDSKS